MKKPVKYPENVTPREKGLQLSFYYKGARMRPFWKCDPNSQANANSAGVSVKAIKDKIEQEERGMVKIEDIHDLIEQHIPGYERPKKHEKKLHTDLLHVRMTAWLDSVKHQKSHSVITDYTRFIRNFAERWPNLMIQDLDVGHLRKYIVERQTVDKVMFKTICNEMGPIRKTVKRALREGKITSNPFDQLDPDDDLNESREEIAIRAINGGEEDDVDPFDLKETKTLLTSQLFDPQERNLIAFLLEGPRTGEGLALAWQDVDFKNKRARIYKTFTDGKLGIRKNGREIAWYWLELSDRAIAALRDQMQYTYAQQAVDMGDPFGPLKFVFHNPRTNRVCRWTNTLQQRFETVLPKLKVRYRPPYQLRHTFATHALSACENPTWVANKLGHAHGNTEMLRRHYAKWMKEVAESAGYHGGELLKKAYESR